MESSSSEEDLVVQSDAANQVVSAVIENEDGNSRVSSKIVRNEDRTDYSEKFKSVREKLTSYLMNDSSKISKSQARMILKYVVDLEQIVIDALVDCKSASRALNLMKKEGITDHRMTYSQVAATNIAAVPKVPLPKTYANSVLIVKSKEGSNIDSSEGVKDQVLKTVMPKLGSVKVRNIRRLRDKKILIETDSVNDKELIKNFINEQKGPVLAESPRKIGPKLIIFDVNKGLSDDCILNEIFSRNLSACGVSKQEFMDSVKIRFKTNQKKSDNRDESKCNVIIEVSGKIRLSLLQKERVYMQFESHKIKDFEALTKCFKCLGFGHTSTHCGKDIEICSHCALQGHKKANCPRLQENPKCVNCLSKKKPYDHSPFDNSCPEYKRALDLMRSRITYD